MLIAPLSNLLFKIAPKDGEGPSIPLAMRLRRISLHALPDDFDIDNPTRWETYSEAQVIQLESLEPLTRFPLDVLYEIFGHLHPYDLLQLARTTQRLRTILMRRSAAGIWKATISNVEGLPECPSDLDEPQYVNLAFDDHCHLCFDPNVHDVFWSCRVRCCKSCVEENFVSDFDLKKRIPVAPGDHRYKTIFPYIVYPRPGPYRPGRILFYLPVAERYIREFRQLENKRSMEQWSSEKKEEQSRRLTHAALCESWSGHWVHKRSRELHMFMLVILALCFVVVQRG